MIDQPTVAVIVVNWNGRAYLDKCLSRAARSDLSGV